MPAPVVVECIGDDAHMDGWACGDSCACMAAGLGLIAAGQDEPEDWFWLSVHGEQRLSSGIDQLEGFVQLANPFIDLLHRPPGKAHKEDQQDQEEKLELAGCGHDFWGLFQKSMVRESNWVSKIGPVALIRASKPPLVVVASVFSSFVHSNSNPWPTLGAPRTDRS